MRRSLKFGLLQVFLIWPVFTILLMIIGQMVRNPMVDTWQEMLTIIVFYGLMSMFSDIILYLGNAIVLIILRSIFFRFQFLRRSIQIFLVGAFAGALSFLFGYEHGINIYRETEIVHYEFYNIFAFVLVGGLFFLLGKRRKIKTEAR